MWSRRELVPLSLSRTVLLPTQTAPQQNLFRIKMAFHTVRRPYPEGHGGPAQKQFPHQICRRPVKYRLCFLKVGGTWSQKIVTICLCLFYKYVSVTNPETQPVSRSNALWNPDFNALYWKQLFSADEWVHQQVNTTNIVIKSFSWKLNRPRAIKQYISNALAHKHLSDAVQLAVGALGLVLWPKLQLLLLLLKVDQIPLVLQTGLPPLPELQKQRHCRGTRSITPRVSREKIITVFGH